MRRKPLESTGHTFGLSTSLPSFAYVMFVLSTGCTGSQALWKPPETRNRPLTHAALRESVCVNVERKMVVHICGKPC